MARIAEEVGITAGALYRHFENKSTVLERVFEESFAWLDNPLGPGEFFEVVDEAIGVLVDQTFVARLWIHERRYLPVDSNTALARRMDRWRGSLRSALQSMHPDLTLGQIDLLLAATQSALFYLGRRAIRVPPAEQVSAVRAAIKGIVTTELAAPRARPNDEARRRMPVSLRERILLAASEHFGRGDGYHGTAMSSIGMTAGVTGPSLYLHFKNKADVLRAVHEREAHALWIELDAVLATVSDAAKALAMALVSWVRVIQPGAATLEDPTGETLGSLGTSIAAQREFVAELVALLVEARPELSPLEARARIQIGLIIVADLFRDPEISTQPTLQDDATALVLGVVGVPAPPNGPRSSANRPDDSR
ncbi:TetR/AcrR family transcriptional regulator [Amycolatopsis ultiminotia]|uniref:TetR/AcrR family transcriptional regulator n=2 Tax=Amycolatopsis ultiminotia TaxID=543629 RepID=A0ABP6V4W3_9PSEU